MSTIVFWILASLVLGGGLGVVFSRNPVGSLLSMVMALASVAGIFVLLEAHFLAAIQVMVYAGAIMVLFLFVIMLLNLGHGEDGSMRLSLWTVIWWIPPFAVVGAIGGIMAVRLSSTDIAASPAGAESIDAAVASTGAVGAIADPLFTQYLVSFEVTGILLLVAVVGALALAKKSV